MYRTKSYRIVPHRIAAFQTVLYRTVHTYLLAKDMKVPGVEPSPGDFLTLSFPERILKIKWQLKNEVLSVLKGLPGAVVF
jgi:hypothetical protein